MTDPAAREGELRELANRWSRSATGWEQRAGAALTDALTFLDSQRVIDAWLAREVGLLRAELAALRAAAKSG